MDIIRVFPTDAACMQHAEQLRWGETNYLDNLKLLCAAYNSVKGDRTQEHLLARLQEQAA